MFVQVAANIALLSIVVLSCLIEVRDWILLLLSATLLTLQFAILLVFFLRVCRRYGKRALASLHEELVLYIYLGSVCLTVATSTLFFRYAQEDAMIGLLLGECLAVCGIVWKLWRVLIDFERKYEATQRITPRGLVQQQSPRDATAIVESYEKKMWLKLTKGAKGAMLVGSILLFSAVGTALFFFINHGKRAVEISHGGVQYINDNVTDSDLYVVSYDGQKHVVNDCSWPAVYTSADLISVGLRDSIGVGARGTIFDLKGTPQFLSNSTILSISVTFICSGIIPLFFEVDFTYKLQSAHSLPLLCPDGDALCGVEPVAKSTEGRKLPVQTIQTACLVVMTMIILFWIFLVADIAISKSTPQRQPLLKQ